MAAPAGWYEDSTDPARLRYWDGNAWTEHYTLKSGVEQTGSPPAAIKPSKVSFFSARKVAEDLQLENVRLQAIIDDHGLKPIVELESLKFSLDRQIQEAQLALSALDAERRALADLVVNLRATAELQGFGLYDYENPAESSISLSSELEQVRAAIRAAVRAGTATTATSNFTFNNSMSQGHRFVADMSKLLLRAYNAEAENCVKTVKAGNLQSAQKRLSTAVEQIERLGGMISLQITPYYHGLRLRELELASRHLEALQAEREMERARRDELREAKKVEAELARERDRLEKEREHYLNTLKVLEEKGDFDGTARIVARLEDVDRAIADVDYRAANVRAGYVYVVSNIGSFGPEVIKIGMTRRLEPRERIYELGDASVPFPFDIHAMIFSDDAPALEATLHAHFADRRINRVNLRREYFRATALEVREALTQHRVEVLEFTIDAEAAEYWSSSAMS